MRTNYTAFGLQQKGIGLTQTGSLHNFKNTFQKQEFNEDLGTDIYEFKYRMDDPQIGRFWQVDPLADSFRYNSVYDFSEDRVINGVELEGKEWRNFMSKFKDPSELTLKPIPSGKGVQQQYYTVTVGNSSKSLNDLFATFEDKPQAILSNSKAEFSPVDGNGKELTHANLKVGSNIEIDINGPLNNSYVRVIGEKKGESNFSFTFGTLDGHIEQGGIQFSASQDKKGNITFSIFGISKIDQFATSVFSGTARKEQQASWQEVLTNVVKYLQGTEVNRNQKIINEK